MTRFTLPPGFDELVRYEEWALATEAERSERRRLSTMEVLDDYYETMTPRAQDIYGLLERTSLDEMDEPTENLFLLMLSLQEIAICVERFREPGLRGVQLRDVEIVPLGMRYLV